MKAWHPGLFDDLPGSRTALNAIGCWSRSGLHFACCDQKALRDSETNPSFHLFLLEEEKDHVIGDIGSPGDLDCVGWNPKCVG